MQNEHRNEYQAWLLGDILLAGLLGASLALFLAYPVLQTSWDLPQLRLVLQTTMALAGLLVAVLAAVRFSVEGRRLDLLLASGFFVTALSAFAFAIGPQLGGRTTQGGRGLGGPARRHPRDGAHRRRTVRSRPDEVPRLGDRQRRRRRGIALLVAWSLLRAAGTALPASI